MPNTTDTSNPINQEGFTTQILHHDRRSCDGLAEVHAPTCNSVLFGYEKTEDLCDVFQGRSNNHAYARQSTPTTNTLQSLVALTEDSPRSLLFSTGMAALSSMCLTLLKAGDHLIASRFLFGNTHSFFNSLIGYGIEVSFVDTCDATQVAEAVKENTRMVFTETLANPGTQIPDFKGIAKICNSHNLVFVIDSTLTTGYVCKGKELGAHFVVMSLTKAFNGHGNVLGGALVDTGTYDWSNYPNIFEAYRKGDPYLWGLQQVKKKGLRDMGATLSAESASRIAIGVETIALRLERSCSNATALAAALAKHPKVETVYHPSLESHPQFNRAKEYFRLPGYLMSLDLKAGYDPIEFLNAMPLVINATHLGDNRTLALPVAKTIFHEMGVENRQAQGISENMIRCSIGIEDPQDLLDCFINALDKLEHKE